jgi:hypothetical protein
VTNCILWCDTPEEIYSTQDSSTTITYSNVHGGWPDEGNINISPCFVNPDADDYRLSWYSPCVDSGDNSAPGLPATDLAGNSRVMDGNGDTVATVDMGAYELEPDQMKVGIGTLNVAIEPNEAISAGAMWKIQDGGQWYSSDEVVALTPGYYKIELYELAHWAEPETLVVGYETVDANAAPQQSFWVRVVADIDATVTAQYKRLPVFDIDRIPPRDAPHGRPLEFHVAADWLGDDAVFSATMSFDPNYPAPEGPMFMDPVTGLFTYEPNDANDRTGFTVTFRAESGIDANEQTITIKPVADLIPEYEILSRPVHPLSDPCEYVIEIESEASLNGKEVQEVLSVTVAGVDITIDENDNLVYTYNGHLDINDLTICAETVTICNSLHLPQTNVTIYARDLYFEDHDGRITDINTTPMDFRPHAGMMDGLSAGNINLYIESYHATGGLNGRLIMNGTRGIDGGKCGDDGVLTCTLDSSQPFAWLSPYALKMIIAHARDAYLCRYTAEAHDMLHEYATLLNTYRALPQWNDLPEQWRLEFGQMHQEMITLLHRIENGLDYFGNPPDWVPALSFEVLYTAYETEIEHAIRVMYLSYWLLTKADDATKKTEALSNYRNQLWDDTVQAKDDYAVVKDLIGPLKVQAESIAAKIGRADSGGCSGLLCSLKRKETELLQRAEADVHEANKVPWYETALSTISTIGTSMISGTQAGSSFGPEGAVVGMFAGWAVGSIDVLTDESIMNPNPWPEASMRTDVARQFGSIDFDKVSEEWLQDFDEIEDVTNIESEGVYNYLGNLEANAAEMAAGLWDVKEALKTTSLDSEEVETKLKEIKATDPTFNWLVDEVTELMVEKQLFNTQLAAAMQKISTLANSMTNNVLAVDALNRDLRGLNKALDPHVLMYVKDMEHRALARLQRYHYYLAKAYEYRLLEPYPGDLSIDNMFERIQQIAKAPLDEETTNGYLGPDDFAALKVVYEEQLRELTDHILTLFLEGREEKSVETWFEISDPEELSVINAGEPLKINLFEKGLFPSDKENIRIVRMQVEEGGMDVSLTGDCSKFGQIVINMQHPAVSKMQYLPELTPGTGNIYQFRHLAEDTKEPLNINWKSEYNIINGQLSHPQLSASQQSLLWVLLADLGQTENALIYSRPGAWADIAITKRDNLPRPGPDLPPCKADIDYLLIRVEYDYYEKNAKLQTLRVTTEPNIPAGLSSYELLPYYLVDTPDKCGRRDGIGDFYRAYQVDATPMVTVTAPATYGNWRFDKWTDKQGYTLGHGQTLGIEFLPPPDDNPTVWAEYVYEGPMPNPADFNSDFSVDFDDYSALSSAWYTAPGDGKWNPELDISDPPDNIIDMADLKPLAEYWLAAP